MNSSQIPAYLDRSAARVPDRPAIVEPDGRSLTYEALLRQANAFAGFLASQGVRPGDRVGVVLHKSLEAVVALLGILKAGAAYVAVDVSAPAARSRQILADCRIRALVADAGSLDVCPPAGDLDQPLAAIVTVGSALEGSGAVAFESALAAAAPAPEITDDPDRIAYILYTSGSTGLPKGVTITHANVASYVEWCSREWRPTEHDRFSSHPPFHFDPSVSDLYVAARHGASVHLIPDDLGRKPKELARMIADHRLTIWSSTPSTMLLLMQYGDLAARDSSHLRLVTFGGEVFPIGHLREMKRYWPTPVYYNMYGPTETTVACTSFRVPDVIPADRSTPFPIGFPFSHCGTLLLDDAGCEVANDSGREGLLHISGPSLSPGYWNRPRENAAAFVERDGVRWYNTGDVVRWDREEGFTYVGRRDRMVKRRGFRIELGEIERALYEHPAIREAAVLGLPDAEAGVRIVAVVSCRTATPPSIVELKTFCATRVPTYMSPDRFVFQPLLPRTSTDKVDYQVLTGQLTDALAAR